jgi:hypothetical protein
VLVQGGAGYCINTGRPDQINCHHRRVQINETTFIDGYFTKDKPVNPHEEFFCLYNAHGAGAVTLPKRGTSLCTPLPSLLA